MEANDRFSLTLSVLQLTFADTLIYDPNCNEGEMGVGYLKRQLGNNAPEGEALASELGAAIDSMDWSKLPSYLWANPPAALSQY